VFDIRVDQNTNVDGKKSSKTLLHK
jgi:hypothetical protein